MYNTYFGFSDFPFENNQDQKFLFLSEDYREVLAALLYFAETKKGFAIVCGDVGTGKSMLINSFLDRLPESAHPIMILNPFVRSLDILIHIAKALKVRITGNESLLNLTDKVKKALTSAKLQEKSFVLIIDEAHLLSDQALEEIRLLSNIEPPDQKLLQILLIGQCELSHRLIRPEMRHLHRRITVKRFLSPLNPEESIQYVDRRLKQVGSSFAAVFEDQCRNLIFKLTEGCPRLINQLCDNALLICMTEGRRKVNRKVVQKAHEAWQTSLIFSSNSSKPRTYRVKKPNKPLIVSAGSVAVVVLLGIIALRSGFAVDNFQGVLQQVHSVIQTATGPQTPSAAKSEDLRKPENESARLRQSVKPKEAPASSLENSTSTPIPFQLPEGSGRTEITSNLSSPENRSPHPLGAIEMKPAASGNPQLAEISTNKEGLEKPKEALNEVDGPPTPSPKPTPAQVLSASSQLVAQAGDSLSRIANLNYPHNKKLGLVALILANPEITNENKILPRQTLYLPEVCFDKETIRLRDKQFYAIYGRYLTSESLKKDISLLQQKNVHFVLRDTNDSKRNVVYRVFLGGYGTEAELEKVLESVDLKSAEGHRGIGLTNRSVGRVKNPAKLVDEAITVGNEASGNPKVTDMYLNRGMENDPVIPNFNNKPGISSNKFEAVGKAFQATFQKNQNNVITSKTKGDWMVLSEVQLEQVHVKTFLSIHKVDSTLKLDKSFNGFIGLGRANQSSGLLNSQANIVSFDGFR